MLQCSILGLFLKFLNVSCLKKIQMKDKADIDVLIAMPGDGECFGELSLYDFNKIRVKQQGT